MQGPRVRKVCPSRQLGRAHQGGVGLGLSVVKQIVTRLGGEVGFADAPGGGAIFHFEVPGWQPIGTASELDADPNAQLPPTLRVNPRCGPMPVDSITNSKDARYDAS
ncbi:ATP-binding protein [Bradyrhizobium sp.]|uniref:ATP-binding protein n=1 Tax=Bradyrhizobium sp. TaxID=376 RepID=UPI003BB0DE1B